MDDHADRADPDADPLSTLVREPQQARSRKTLSRIVAAADALLVDRGPDALTVAAIARRARASVGSFYARFDGKEELVRYLGETALQAAAEDWSDRFNEALGEALAEVAHASEGTDDEGAQALSGPLRDLAGFLLESFRSGPPSRLERLDRIEDPDPARLARFQGRVLQDLEELFARVAGCGEIQGEVAARMFLSAVRALAAAGGAPGSHPSVAADPSTAATEVARATGLYLAASRIPEAAAREAAASASPASAPSAPGSAPPAEGAPADRATDAEPVPEPIPEPRPDRPEIEEPVSWAEADEPLPWSGGDEPPSEPPPERPPEPAQETAREEPRAEPEETPTWGELAWEYPESGQAERSRPEASQPESSQPESTQPEPSESEPSESEATQSEPHHPEPQPGPGGAAEGLAQARDPGDDEPGDEDADDEDTGDVELFDVWG